MVRYSSNERDIDMTKANWRGISAKRRYALLQAWKTEYGTEHLSTGPITWSPRYDGENAFELFANLGWSIEKVNYELTEALYDELSGSDLMDSIIRDLLEQAQDEWSEEQKERAIDSTSCSS
jgi:hypothetical protein